MIQVLPHKFDIALTANDSTGEPVVTFGSNGLCVTVKMKIDTVPIVIPDDIIPFLIVMLEKVATRDP